MESESSMDVGETSLDQTAPPLVPDPDSSERDEAAVEVHDMVVDAQSAVLTNDDLLSLIFSFHSINIFDPSDAPTSLASLLQASLTCKTFFHPAIRALWQSMNSIVPLLKLIPGVVKDVNGPGENDSLTINRVISEEDLLRFDFYAQFIGRFELSAQSLQDFTKNGIVMGDMIFLLIQGYRPRGLLPALRVLEVMHSVRLRVEDVWLLQLLVPSTGTLSRLSIRGTPTGGEGILVASILKSAHMKSPTTLSVIALDDCRDWAILNVLKDIKSLKRISLDLRFFTYESQFQNPGSMVDLVMLQLCGSVKDVYKILCTVFPHTPQLRILNISRLTIAQRDRGQTELLRHLADEITTRTDLSLDSLTIETTYFQPRSLTLSSSLRYFNGPSSSCQKLRTLSISISDLSSATFTKLFHAPYRSLVSLEITSGIASNRLGQYGFKKSLAILELIHNMAPNLKYLYIPIFFNTGDGESFEPTDVPKTCHGLQELGLKSCQLQSATSNAKDKYPESYFPSQKIADLLTIARYFDHLFPHLKKIDTSELREFVEERWLDGLEAAVKHFGEQRRLLDWDCKVCGK